MTVKDLIIKFNEPQLNVEIRTPEGHSVFHGKALTVPEIVQNYNAKRVVLVIEADKVIPNK